MCGPFQAVLKLDDTRLFVSFHEISLFHVLDDSVITLRTLV